MALAAQSERAGSREEPALGAVLLAPATQWESSCHCQLWKSFSLADHTDLCAWGSVADAAVYVRGLVTAVLSAAPPALT